MKRFIVQLLLLFIGCNSLFSQNYPPPIWDEEVDYTLFELKIVNKDLLESMDTISLVKDYSPYLLFQFYSQSDFNASLSYIGKLPTNNSPFRPIGFFNFKGFIALVSGQPINSWFEKTGKKKHFYEKRKSSIYVLGGGDKIWYFNVENDKIVSIIQLFEE